MILNKTTIFVFVFLLAKYCALPLRKIETLKR